MAKIKAVIFDMDGTLLDSRELIYQAMEDILALHAVQGVTREHMAELMGKPIHAMYETLAPGHDPYELEKAHIAHHDEHMHLLRGYDGLHELLGQLKARGIALGIFTGFDKRAHDRLKAFEISSYFDSVVETTRYAKHKPDPEGLLLAMQDLKASPEETLYVGDALTDVLAGKAAAVQKVVAVTHGFGSREVLETAGADYIIDSLGELLAIVDKS